LSQNLPGVEQVATSSTAQAAKMAKDQPGTAAVAGELAAKVYRLNVLHKNIHDRAENFTRFLVIGRQKAKKTRHNKTSVMFSIKDESGSLLKTLQLFARNNINLTKIQSRPLRNRPWEYLFFLDFDGHIEEKHIARVIDILSKRCLLIKVLGSYPRGNF
jgi:chorismate mutase/prephenate dehydratase